MCLLNKGTQGRNSPDRVSAGAAVGFMNCDSEGVLWRAAIAPVFNHIQQVIDVNATIVVDVCEFDSKLVMKRIQVIGINITIAVEVTVIDAVGDVVIAEM